MYRAAEGRQHRQMAAMIGIAERQTEQPALPVTHMEFSAGAGFQQRNAGSMEFSLLRITLVVTRLRKAHPWLSNS
jgi:hypothetical protein